MITNPALLAISECVLFALKNNVDGSKAAAESVAAELLMRAKPAPLALSEQAEKVNEELSHHI